MIQKTIHIEKFMGGAAQSKFKGPGLPWQWWGGQSTAQVIFFQKALKKKPTQNIYTGLAPQPVYMKNPHETYTPVFRQSHIHR